MKKTVLFLAALVMLTISCSGQNNNTTTSDDNTTAQTEAKATKAPGDTVIVKSIPKGLPVDDILDAILADYKGQVVVIDFWATWCPPCMNAMKQIDPIKQKYIDSRASVAFVYVTGETSPMPKWKQTIPGIKGYHYRLSDKEFNGLMRVLGIRGIPAYYIADKKGKHSYDNIAEGGYPGDDVITAKIEEALNKK